MIDATGEVIRSSAVATRQPVHGGTTVTFSPSLAGPWGDDAVLGVVARFDGQEAPVGVCTPLCPSCDTVKTQHACERFDLLLKGQQARPNAAGARPLEERPPNLQSSRGGAAEVSDRGRRGVR